MNVATFFGQKATFEQQLDNPGARGFRPQPIGRAQDLFQIFILHEAGNSGHRGKQCRISEMTRRLGLAFDHFPLFTQQLITFGDNRQRRTVVFLVALFTAQ